jgi:hypothetical protein
MTWIAVAIAAGGAGRAAAQPVSPPPLGTSPSPPPEAVAEDPRPREALTFCAGGEVTRGIAILAALYAETRNPAFVFNQARCYQQNGRLAEARERFQEYLRVGTAEPPADIKRAHGFIEEIDREQARRMAVQDARPLQRNHRAALRTTSIALAATSVAALGTGAFLSYRVQAKERDIEKKYSPMPVIEGPMFARDTSAGARLETFQYIAYGVGVAALAGAVTTFGLSGWSLRDEPVSAAPILTYDTVGGVMRLRF